MAFTKITASGIGSTETVTLDGLTVINDVSIGGTLTYEDVTNIDSVGLITARAGVNVGSGITLSKDGDIFATGVTTSTTFVGNLTGNADTATNSTNSSHILVTDNESTNENNLITFVEDATSSTGNVGLEMDGNLTYNPSTGTVSATAFSGDGSALTGIGGTDFIHSEQINNSGVTTTGTAVVGGGVTISESGIEASGIGITCANINGTQIGGRRNIVINGKAQINQRGNSTGNTSGGYYGPDRFETALYGGTYSHSRAASGSTLPEFPTCFQIDCTSAASAPSGTNETKIKYHMEGQDVQHLQYGSSSAKSTTLSFYVRSNKTETYTVWYYRPDGSRMNAVNFSISAADTWEKKVITIVGDTTSAIADDNTMGYKIEWVLAAGSSYTSGSALNGSWANLSSADRYVGNTGTFGQSTNDYFELTGVQFEVGSQATAFEHRSVGDELHLCQRYYETSFEYHHLNASNGESDRWIRFKVSKRANPTLTTAPTNSVSFAAQNGTTEGFAGNGSGNSHANFNLEWTADAEL